MKKYIITIISSILAILVFSSADASTDLNAEIKIFNSSNITELSRFSVLNNNISGGINIAAGDFDGNGSIEIAIAAGVNQYPEVKIYSSQGKYLKKRFLPFDEKFRGGISVAAGDVNGDGKDELIFGQSSLGESRVKIYKYSGKIIKDFLAYAPGVECGVNLAAGDINHDGKDEIITGAGRKGGPHVRIFDGKGNPTKYNYFPFHPDFRGGISVDIGDVNGDGTVEIITSQAGDGQAWVKIYQKNGKTMAYEMLYPSHIESGVKVKLSDIDNDGRDEIITSTGYNGGPEVKIYKYKKGKFQYINKRGMLFDENSRQGVNIEILDINKDGRKEIISAPGNIKPIQYGDVNLPVPLMKQERSLSCEAASLRMALAYKGVNLSEEELLNVIGYDRTDKNGSIWGDPQYGFVGYVTGRQISSGYGVYWRPVARAASNYRESYYFEGMSLRDMLSEVGDGNPVVMWGTKSNTFLPVYWRTAFGREIFALIGEHARVVRGFVGSIDNPSYIITNDPAYGEQIFSKEEFVENWRFFNNSGVVVK